MTARQVGPDPQPGRPRVLIVTGIFPPDTGGPASYVPAIADVLWREDRLAAVITLSDRQFDDAERPYPVIRIARRQNRIARRARTIAAIAHHARRADVVYLNGLVLEGLIAARMVRRRPAVVKVVGDLVWEHARNRGATTLGLDEFQTSRLPLAWRLLRRLQATYMRAADRIIVPSRYLETIVCGWGVPKDRIRLVYNAAPVAAGDDVEPRYDLVTVARLVPWKGVDVLIELAAANQWSLLVVGEGPLRNILEARAAELNARVIFTGHVPKERVASLIKQAKVFVLNSTYEGLPHIVLEAKLAARPVVATAVGGTPETIEAGVNGFLTPPGDRGTLAATLSRLLSDDLLRREIALTGQRHALEHFSFEAMCANTFAVLDSFVQKTR